MNNVSVNVMKLVFSFIVRVAFHFGSSTIDQLKAGVIVELLEYVCSGCYGDSNYLKEYELLIRKGLQSERQTIVMMSYSCFFIDIVIVIITCHYYTFY